MLTKQAYLADPCRASSLPYWKACRIVPSPEIVLVHEENFAPANYPDYQDEPYFRLRHNLKATPAPQLPDGFSVCALSLSEYAVHINRCYEDIGVTESELRQFTDRPVYDAPCGLRQKTAGPARWPRPVLPIWTGRSERAFWNGFRYRRNTGDVGWAAGWSANCCGVCRAGQISPPYPAGAAIPLIRSSFTVPVVLQAVMYGTS